MIVNRLLSPLAVLALAATAGAQSIQFAPGNANADYTAGLDGPAHVIDTMDPTLDTWNAFGAGAGLIGAAQQVPDPTGLVFADGTAAPGVTFDFGLGFDGSNIDFSLAPGQSGDGFPFASGAGSPFNNQLWANWAFSDGRNGNPDQIGVRISGLAADDYRVYVLSRERPQLGRTYSADIGVASTATVNAGVMFGDFGPIYEGVAAPNAAALNELEDYFVEDVTLAAGEEIVIITDPTNDDFGHISGIQIVSLSDIQPEGDVNGDFVVDITDFSGPGGIKENFFSGTPGGAPVLGEAIGAQDGVVDIVDFVVWKRNFVAGGGSLEGVSLFGGEAPEPSSFAVLLFGSALGLRFRFRQ